MDERHGFAPVKFLIDWLEIGVADIAVIYAGQKGDAVEVYTGQILPTVAKARSEDYAVSTVSEDHGVYRLVQMRKTMADEEVTLSPGKVISNKK